MNGLLQSFLKRSIRRGTLEIVDATGALHGFGDGSGQPVKIKIASPEAEWKLVRQPDLYLGELYMDGELAMLEGSIYDLLALALSNVSGADYGLLTKIAAVASYVRRRLDQMNGLRASRRNIRHHYDLDGRLYRLFLDPDMQYSCAYFDHDKQTLEGAQLAKKRHLAAKLDIRPGQRILDIGSGWGGLGLYLASNFDVEVVGLTLSDEQHKVSTERAANEGLGDRVQFRIQDYRKVDGPFDRIVSVGMFEHVGVGYFRTYFDKCRDLLTKDGVMVLHTIGRLDGPSYTAPWIQKYIFPGGYIPALSEVMPAIEKSRLVTTDVEILRLHYARTLRAWRERFMAHWDTVKGYYDERFCRMWEFYLAVSEAAFQYGGMVNFQIQLVKDQYVLPLTRDYILDTEHSLAGHDARPRLAAAE